MQRDRAFGARRAASIVAALCVASLIGTSSADAQWTQWGGPTRDFVCKATDIADQWPETGPKQLWSSELGEGYSTILVEDGVLYTMYRKGSKEIVAAISTEDGKTVWDFKYSAPLPKDMNQNYGVGPRSTPLIVGDRIFTVGIGGKVHTVDKKTGKKVWKTNLLTKFKGTSLLWGYSSSPLAYKETIILPTGGKGKSIIALNQADGEVVWAKHDFANGYASPMLIEIDGKPQVICFMAEDVVAVNPDNGELLWSHPHKTDWSVNASTPIWSPEDNLLLVSSAYNTGSRALKLTPSGDGTKVEEVWSSNKLQVHFGSAIRIGEFIYGSSGNSGRINFVGMNVRNGERAWADGKQFSKASCLLADGKLIILDEDGKLGLATATPEGLEVHSTTQLFDARSWTVPTLVGKTLFARDESKLVALDLG